MISLRFGTNIGDRLCGILRMEFNNYGWELSALAG
jgi:hypothetical protein